MKIAINGFGRIGRATFKILLEKHKNLQVVAINDLTDNDTLAHLLKYDTVYGVYDKKVKATKTSLVVDSKSYKSLSEKDPEKLPWKELGVDIVLECTGLFRTKESAGKHLKAGAKKVILSAPAKDDKIPTYVLGVNHQKIKKSDKIISNASCTTNCIAPITKIIEDKIGIKKVMMTTIHAYTAGQNLIDGPKNDLRRARSAAENIVPTTTGAAIATQKVIPKLKGKFDGISVRVPIPVVSMSDFVFLLKKKTTEEKVNKLFVQAKKQAQCKGILDATEEPLVSSDFIGNPYSTIVDLQMTKIVDGDLLKIVAWYDNEWGYSSRLADMVSLVS
ncbi:type I glyceraldehyde-3-phosphate dehydrogenase [Candidatus Falkowbacteria bacterium]|jgi:glyceraldehyde 3-phosphate dehydrogenase|nr:type I glyceraldehyde-3-phosphate dehydrogenase [Candidatus Falkowbacteria bacterium]MBT4433479.1 type I glyceraldehyde-3-phosphate dehydrogenase [Candidatus Falkowbacteria bacterium]